MINIKYNEPVCLLQRLRFRWNFVEIPYDTFLGIKSKSGKISETNVLKNVRTLVLKQQVNDILFKTAESFKLNFNEIWQNEVEKISKFAQFSRFKILGTLSSEKITIYTEIRKVPNSDSVFSTIHYSSFNAQR